MVLNQLSSLLGRHISNGLSEHAPPALRGAVLGAVHTPCLLVCLDLGCLRHLHRRSAVVAGVVPVGQWSRADTTQARSVVVAKGIVARTACIEVLVVAFACAAATAVFVWLGCVVGRSVGVRAARGLMQAELLLLVVGLVANSC